MVVNGNGNGSSEREGGKGEGERKLTYSLREPCLGDRKNRSLRHARESEVEERYRFCFIFYTNCRTKITQTVIIFIHLMTCFTFFS